MTLGVPAVGGVVEVDRVFPVPASLRVRHARNAKHMAPTLAPAESRFKINICPDLVGMAGFEPAASCSQSRRANQAAPHPVNRTVAYRPWRRACAAAVAVPGTHQAPPAAMRPPVCCQGRLRCLRTGTLSVLTRYQVLVISYRACGRSSMAEPQPSKLVMRVRFPSPAPPRNPRSRLVPLRN
jgi:hypothetical protein